MREGNGLSAHAVDVVSESAFVHITKHQHRTQWNVWYILLLHQELRWMSRHHSCESCQPNAAAEVPAESFDGIEHAEEMAIYKVCTVRTHAHRQTAAGTVHLIMRSFASDVDHLWPRGTNSTCESDGGDSDGQGTPQGGRGVRSTPSLAPRRGKFPGV